MSGRQSKKLRQAVRRALRTELPKLPTPAQLAAQYRLQIRPAPRWCPERVWTWLAAKFLTPAPDPAGP